MVGNDASATPPVRVLFLCTHNAARSQIAAALLERRSHGEYVVASGGTKPADVIHPMTIETLARAGIDWTGKRPLSVQTLAHEQWDMVITVCDKAREACPTFPGRPTVSHWRIPDPLGVSEADREAAFWDVLNQLGRRIDLLIALGKDRVREAGHDQLQEVP